MMIFRPNILALLVVPMVLLVSARRVDYSDYEGPEDFYGGLISQRHFAPPRTDRDYFCEFRARLCDPYTGAMRRSTTALRYSIIENLYLCVSELISRIYSSDLKFPKACCNLPVFNFICNATKK